MLRYLLTVGLLAALPCIIFAQAANDDCAMAEQILPDLNVPFSTIDATNSGPVVTGCGGFTPAENDSIPADVWFFWEATESGTYSWSTCGTAPFDSRMAVYLGTDACAVTNDDLVNCNDDGAAGCTNSESDLVFVATAGNTYVLRLGGFANEETPITSGEGTVRLTKLNVPENDACANAIPVSLGLDQQFTTANAITDGPDHDGSNPCFQFNSLTVGQDIWYTYTAGFTGTVQWTTCDEINFDSRMAVYRPGSPCPPAPEDLYGCNDDGPDCPAGTFHSDLFFDVTQGETYLLRLGGFGGAQGFGTFDLVNNNPPEPPVNDDCANAIETQIITPAEADDFDFAEVGTTIGATFEEATFVEPTCTPFNPGGLWGDVWYTVQTQRNDTIQMRIFPDGEAPATDFFVEAFASCTDTLVGASGTCLFVDSGDRNGLTSTITGLPIDDNITIYIRVVTRLTTQAPGGFGLQLVSAISTSTRNELRVEDLKLFPNPAREQVTVSMDLPEAANLEARVFDLLGRNVINRQLGNMPGGQQRFTLETNDLAPGVYSMQLTDGRATRSIKFVIN